MVSNGGKVVDKLPGVGNVELSGPLESAALSFLFAAKDVQMGLLT